MKNLDQLRAARALEASGQKATDGTFEYIRADVAGFPALVMQNGLLSAFAYACEEGKPARKGLKFACNQTARHLADPLHGITVLAETTTASEAIGALCRIPATETDLQRATTESLAFFGYLKRFAASAQPKD